MGKIVIIKPLLRYRRTVFFSTHRPRVLDNSGLFFILMALSTREILQNSGRTRIEIHADVSNLKLDEDNLFDDFSRVEQVFELRIDERHLTEFDDSKSCCVPRHCHNSYLSNC